MILASRITCRCTLFWVCRMKFSTVRSSDGRARTTTSPDSGETTTERPFSVPIMARMDSAKDFQNSFSVMVSIWLLACTPRRPCWPKGT